MNPLKENLRAVLNFSVSEKRGILVLITIMILIHLIPLLLDIMQEKEEKEIIESSLILFEKQLSGYKVTERTKHDKAVKYFNFDPNNVGHEKMELLGIPPFLLERIIKYRKAGGRFFQKEDLKKIYGMTEPLYRNLEPYIVIENQTVKSKKKKSKEKVIIDIGSADSTKFTSLRGIGPVYAHRIISYRAALGGFTHIEQLKEVYGISDSLYLSLLSGVKLDSSIELNRIKINDINLNDLRKHPYFRNYNLSKVIINYREMNGPYRNTEDLGKIHLMTDSIIERLLPYIDFE